MKPLMFEIRRTLSRRFVIVMLIVIVVISLFATLVLASSNSISFSYASNADVMEQNGTSLHLVNYVFNEYGTPLKGAKIYANVTNGTTGKMSSTVLVTDSLGYANETMLSDTLGKNATLSVTTESYGSTFINTFDPSFFLNLPSGTKFYSPGFLNESNPQTYLTFQILRAGDSASSGIMLLYRNYTGTSAGPTNIFLEPGSNTFSSQIRMNNSTAIFLGTYSGFQNYITFPQLNGTSQNYYLYVYNGNNTTLYASSMFSLYNPPTITGLEDLVVLALTGILEFFIVITAILIGYFVYGKDKATGVLDSVLAKPITRGQLILSRYFANAVSLVLMISAIVAIDLAVLYILHSTALPFQFALIVIGGVSATALSYLAFVYLFSSLFRSTGAILALSVVFFVFFALVFSILALVLPLALGYPVGSPAYYQVYADLEYMNPSSLLQIGLDSVIPSLSSLSIPDPSAYGITFLGFVVSAVAWVAAPLFAAYFLATRRD